MANDIDKLQGLKKRVKDLEEKKIVAKTRLDEQKKLYDKYVKELKGRGIDDPSKLPSVVSELTSRKEDLIAELEAGISEVEQKVKENG
jgi:hypothetical protein